MTRSRRAGLPRDEARHQPLYARLLGLRYLAPGGFLCFVFLEGAVALGILLALAELVSWWGVLVLPVSVAAMVKLNDVVAGALVRPAVAGKPPAVAAGTTQAGSPGAKTVRLSRGAETVRLSPGGETVRLSPTATARAGSAPPLSGSPTLRPAAIRRAAVDAAPEAPDKERWGMPAMDASALNGPPVPRQWAEDLDDRQQRARQSAARRYE